MPPAIITLTTDFGLDDGYVAAMKGVILSRVPAAQIVDVSHAIPPQDILQAALLLQDTFAYFPAGTVHVVVVDPGVGSARRILVLRGHGHLFVAPDNGVLSGLFSPGAEAFAVNRPDLYLQPVSHTFHGRDIIAPLAAYLAAGQPPESTGEPLAVETLCTLPLPAPVIDQEKGHIRGILLSIDRFGNLLTSIRQADVQQLTTSPRQTSLTIGPHTITAWHDTYSQAPPGQPFLLFSSSGRLEIAINHAHAAQALGATIYTPILLSVC